ncbi:MAG TPA: hypothetical protein PKL84_16385 [Candidatus Hydrogenedentes bacterium]|nr:hypothetical protein [Candidatus Hydrogenedentota bacterium]
MQWRKYRAAYRLGRPAAAIALACLWTFALLFGFGHALAHHEGSCLVCVVAATLGKSLETPPALAAPACIPASAPMAVFEVPLPAWRPVSPETLRGPPAAC